MHVDVQPYTEYHFFLYLSFSLWYEVSCHVCLVSLKSVHMALNELLGFKLVSSFKSGHHTCIHHGLKHYANLPMRGFVPLLKFFIVLNKNVTICYTSNRFPVIAILHTVL